MPATSGCGIGVKLPGKHCGQVGQPRPEAVTRTIAPVTAMPPWLRMTAAAMMRWTRRLGKGRRSTSRRKIRPTGTASIVEQPELQPVVGSQVRETHVLQKKCECGPVERTFGGLYHRTVR